MIYDPDEDYKEPSEDEILDAADREANWDWRGDW